MWTCRECGRINKLPQKHNIICGCSIKECVVLNNKLIITLEKKDDGVYKPYWE